MRAPLGAPSRFASSVFARRHRPWVRASWDEAFGQSQSSEAPSQRGHNAPRTDSRASRERGYEPRPQAPHPTPLSERLMTTPSSWVGYMEYRPIDISSQDLFHKNSVLTRI